MTETLSVVDQGSMARRRRWPWIAAVLGVVLLAAGIPSAIWFAHWRSSLHELVDYPGYGVGGPFPIGKAAYFGQNVTAAEVLSHPHAPEKLAIHISAVRPVIRANSADAQVTVLLCKLKGYSSQLDAVFADDATATCSSLTPFRSGTVTVGFTPGYDDIVISVTPRQAGTVRIAGLEVRYSSGLRHGTQHVGTQIKITSVTPTSR